MDQSGAERQLTLLATNLPKTDFETNVIALNRGGYYANQLRDAGHQVDILEKRFRFDPLTFLRLRRSLHAFNPDIIQSFLFSANSYVRLPGVSPAQSRVIVSERCVDSWKSGWQLKTDRKLMGRMDAMTANSDSVAEFYKTTVGIPDNLITVIPNGVPSDTSNAAGSLNLREELGLSPTARLIGFVGRLAPQKCLADLIWAFQLLRQATDDVFLVLVGNGPERDEMAQLATSFDCRDKVFFLGHRNDAAAVTAQLNAFCLPSSFEGMSNSLMEAMAAGVPVVVSDIPSNLELVTHEQNGVVCPLGDGPALAKAFMRILSDNDFAVKIGAAAKSTIEQNHSVQQMVRKHVDLYQRLTAS